MNDTMRAAADFLLSHDNYDILTHDYPDGDTLGSGYALCRVLRQLGKNARVITTRLPKDFVFLAQGLEEQSFDTQTVVSVDVADEKLLGSNREKYLGKIDLCIDHHEINRVDAPLKCVDPHASSNCEILFELFAEMGQQWAEGLNLSDQIAKYCAGNLTAYQMATNQLGSTKIEWMLSVISSRRMAFISVYRPSPTEKP